MEFEGAIEAAEQARIKRTSAAAATLAQDGTPEPTNEVRKMNTPAYIAAEKIARDIAGSGINVTRNAVLAADKAAADAQRAKDKETANALAQVVAKAAAVRTV